MTTRMDARSTGRVVIVALAAAALIAAWMGYSRPDIVRWFSVFLMCG